MQESQKADAPLTGTGYVVIDDHGNPVSKVHASLDAAISDRDGHTGEDAMRWANYRIAEVGLVVQVGEGKPKIADDPEADEGREAALSDKYPPEGVSRRFLDGYLRLCYSEIEAHLHLATAGLVHLAGRDDPHTRHDVREYLADLQRAFDGARNEVIDDTGADRDYVIVVDDEDEDVASDIFPALSLAQAALADNTAWAEGHKVMAIRYDEYNGAMYEDV